MEPKVIGHENPKLRIYLEWNPDKKKVYNNKRIFDYLVWHLRRLSLAKQEVAIDWDVNYHFYKGETSILMGEKCSKNCVGHLYKPGFFKRYKYDRLPLSKRFISASPMAALVSAGEAYRISRMLYLAAEFAGLKPKIDLTVPMFTDYIER